MAAWAGVSFRPERDLENGLLPETLCIFSAVCFYLPQSFHPFTSTRGTKPKANVALCPPTGRRSCARRTVNRRNAFKIQPEGSWREGKWRLAEAGPFPNNAPITYAPTAPRLRRAGIFLRDTLAHPRPDSRARRRSRCG